MQLCANVTCRYNLLVVANGFVSFSVVFASANGSVALVPGQSVPGTLPTTGTFRYYSFTVPNVNSVASVVLTTSTGNVDLFVSRSQNVNAGTAQWSSVATSAVDQVTISRWNANGDAVVGAYYVAVYARLPSVYTIVLNLAINATNNSGGSNTTVTVTTIIPGPSLGNTVAQGTYRYYQLAITNATWPYDIIITLSPGAGDANLYVTVQNVPNINNYLPTTQRYDWFSTNNGTAADTVTIRYAPPETKSCNPLQPWAGLGATLPSGLLRTVCVYTIGVYGVSAGTTSYQINVRLVGRNQTSELLTSGRSVRVDNLPANEYRFYYVAVPQLLTYTVTAVLVPLSGDPDLFADFTMQQPTWPQALNASGNPSSFDYLSYDRVEYPFVYFSVMAWPNQPASYILSRQYIRSAHTGIQRDSAKQYTWFTRRYCCRNMAVLHVSTIIASRHAHLLRANLTRRSGYVYQ